MPVLIMPKPRALRSLLCGAAILQLGLAVGMALADSQGSSYRDQGVHLHGVGWLNVAVDGDRLLIELISPAMDLIGFEHRPRNAEQQAKLDAARARLQQPEALFAPNAEADCRLAESSVDLALLGQPDDGGANETPSQLAPGHKHEHEQEHEREHEHEHEHADQHSLESHADVYASYVFECQQPLKLDTLSIGFFQSFPGAQKLQVQLISDRGQDALELMRDDRRLAF